MMLEGGGLMPLLSTAAGFPWRVACSMPLWALQLSLSWYVHFQCSGKGVAQGDLLLPVLQLPPGAFPARRAPGDPVSLTLLHWALR